jgi:hypothetical protein
MAGNSRAINRVFTRGVIGGLISEGHNDVFDYVVQRYINDPESKTHGQILSEIYAHLSKEKRNEYYYMNTLLNKLLVGIHSVNTTTALSKIHIGQSIADFIMINGEGNIYALEVKSELDNFERLYDQIRNYYKAFSKVSVLTSTNELDRLEKKLKSFGDIGDAVGIYVLSEKDTIFNRNRGREPQLCDEFLEHDCIFKLLRKREYESILLSQFGELPKVAPVFFFRSSLDLFRQMPIQTAQGLAFKELKKRNKITKTAFEGIPSPLKSVVYFSGLSKKMSELEELLLTNYRG